MECTIANVFSLRDLVLQKLVEIGVVFYRNVGIKIQMWYCNIQQTRFNVTQLIFLETALHVSGGTSTHHQERIQLCLQHLVFVTPLLLSAAIVEELEPV